MFYISCYIILYFIYYIAYAKLYILSISDVILHVTYALNKSYAIL